MGIRGEFDAVTGAFGFSGRSITRMLLAAGREVVTLTAHPNRPHEFGQDVKVAPFNFDDPLALVGSLRGASVLYNTYWIRFAHGGLTFDNAVANSITLVRAAKEAGVERIVHVSITNPSLGSSLPYFKGKAEVEQAIVESGLSYAILRPAVIFGDQGILINNIAYFMRRLPVMIIPGDGSYRLQPIYVEDLAELAVKLGGEKENVVIDAVGPETLTFNDLSDLIGRTVHGIARIVHLSPTLAYYGTRVLSFLLGDVVLTHDEVDGLMANLLISSDPPTGHTLLSQWIKDNAATLGASYMSEIKKHF